MVSIGSKLYDAKERLKESLGYESPREREKQEWEPDFESLSGALEPARKEEERYRRYTQWDPADGEILFYEEKNGSHVGMLCEEGHRIYNPHFDKEVYRRKLKRWNADEGEPLPKPEDEDQGKLIGIYPPGEEPIEEVVEEYIKGDTSVKAAKKKIIKVRAKELISSM